MLALEKWAVGRYKPMAMLAQMVAVSVNDCYEIITQTREISPLAMPQAQGMKLHDWLVLYHRPFQLAGVLSHLMNSPDSIQNVGQTIEDWKHAEMHFDGAIHAMVSHWLKTGITERQQQRANRRLDYYYQRQHLPWLERTFRETEKSPTNMEQWFARPEIIFFLAVAMPCWLEYHTTPWELFQHAWQGDFNALEKLFRLDSCIVMDKCLQKTLFRLRQSNPKQFKQLQKAGEEGRTGKIDLIDVKFLLGGLLMKWSFELENMLNGELLLEIMESQVTANHSEAFEQLRKLVRENAARHPVKCWLKSSDIKQLFDALTRDTTGELVDPDFDQQPNSIYKRLARNAILWPSAWKADKKHSA